MADDVVGYAGPIRVMPGRDVMSLTDVARQFAPGDFICRHVMSPGDLLVRDQALNADTKALSAYESRDSLVFGYGFGDGDRLSTKLGGTPYWPKDLPWPTNATGDALDFLAQIDFRAIEWPVPLPGNLLTIHFDCEADETDFGVGNDSAAFMKWHDTSKPTALFESIDTDDGWGPFHSRPVLVEDYKEFEDVEIDDAFEFRELTVHGTKIGGYSQLFGDNWCECFSAIKSPVFLCSIGSLTLNGDFFKPAEEPENAACWLPTIDGSKHCQPVCFMDVGTFVIVYEEGDPELMAWIMYMP